MTTLVLDAPALMPTIAPRTQKQAYPLTLVQHPAKTDAAPAPAR